MPRSTMLRLRWEGASNSTSPRATSPADAATASYLRAKNKPPVHVVQKSTTSTSKTPDKNSPNIIPVLLSEDNPCSATPKFILARKLAGTMSGAQELIFQYSSEKSTGDP